MKMEIGVGRERLEIKGGHGSGQMAMKRRDEPRGESIETVKPMGAVDGMGKRKREVEIG